MMLRAYDHERPGIRSSSVVALFRAFRSGLSGWIVILGRLALNEVNLALNVVNLGFHHVRAR